MTLSHEGKVVFSGSLMMELNTASQVSMIRQAYQAMAAKPDFVIFDPECTERAEEDGGRTVRLPGPGLDQLVYAEVNDYGKDDGGRVMTIYKASER